MTNAIWWSHWVCYNVVCLYLENVSLSKTLTVPINTNATAVFATHFRPDYTYLKTISRFVYSPQTYFFMWRAVIKPNDLWKLIKSESNNSRILFVKSNYLKLYFLKYFFNDIFILLDIEKRPPMYFKYQHITYLKSKLCQLHLAYQKMMWCP